MPQYGKNRWHESGSATASTATATHAGETGRAHYVTHVSASHLASGGGEEPVLTLKDGGSTIMTWVIDDSGMPISFADPIQITEGNAVSAELTSPGADKIGYVNLAGYTDDAA